MLTVPNHHTEFKKCPNCGKKLLYKQRVPAGIQVNIDTAQDLDFRWRCRGCKWYENSLC